MEGTPLSVEQSDEDEERRKKELEEQEARENRLKKPESLGFFAVESEPPKPSALEMAWAKTERPAEADGPENEPPRPGTEIAPDPPVGSAPERPEPQPEAEPEPEAPPPIPPPPVEILSQEPQTPEAPQPEPALAEKPEPAPEPETAPEPAPKAEAAPEPPPPPEPAPMERSAPEPEPVIEAEPAKEPPAEVPPVEASPQEIPPVPEMVEVPLSPEPESERPAEPPAPEVRPPEPAAPETPEPAPEAEPGPAPGVPAEQPPERQPEPELEPTPQPDTIEHEEPVREVPPAEQPPEHAEEEAGHFRFEEEGRASEADLNVNAAEQAERYQAFLQSASAPELNRSSRAAERKMDIESASKGPLEGRSIETLSEQEMLDIAAEIMIDDKSLKHAYETRMIGERGLRRLLAEYQQGGDMREALRREILEHQIDFERDPAMRDAAAVPDQSSGGTQKSAAGDDFIHRLLQNSSVEPSRHEDSQQDSQLSEPPIYRPDDSHAWHSRRNRSKAALDALFVSVISILFLLVIFIYLSRH